MAYKRILTVQDISCVGQCSLTVALPILSACGIETAILPSAVLSTHTAGFTGFTVRDLTDDIPEIVNHWQQEKICFDGIYTGYLGSFRQIELVEHIFDGFHHDGMLKFVDPAMGDNGKLYTGFDADFADCTSLAVVAVIIENMHLKTGCREADCSGNGLCPGIKGADADGCFTHTEALVNLKTRCFLPFVEDIGIECFACRAAMND